MIKEKIEELISQGLTRKKIAEELNSDFNELRRVMRNSGIKNKMRKFKSTFRDKCNHCGDIVEYSSVERKDIVLCKYKCSNVRYHSDEVKLKISNTLKERTLSKREKKYCLQCSVDITHKRKSYIYCSISCAKKQYMNSPAGKILSARMVKLTMKSQSRRSKNEVLFYEKCANHFKDVTHNEVMFNGWDADVIIKDIKVAVLWNGVWHYKQIYKSQSLEQVQNRDMIKNKEIIKFGYTPYVIKDMGKFSEKKVSDEFDIFLDYVNTLSL